MEIILLSLASWYGHSAPSKIMCQNSLYCYGYDTLCGPHMPVLPLKLPAPVATLTPAPPNPIAPLAFLALLPLWPCDPLGPLALPKSLGLPCVTTHHALINHMVQSSLQKIRLVHMGHKADTCWCVLTSELSSAQSDICASISGATLLYSCTSCAQSRCSWSSVLVIGCAHILWHLSRHA